MPALTAASVTDKQLRDLRGEAVQAGDWRQVDLCDVALGIRPQHTATDRGSIKDSSGRSITRAKARAACAKVISYAQGEAGHGAAPSRQHATKKKSPAQLEREIAEALAGAGSSTPFEEAKAEGALLEKEVDAADRDLKNFPRGAMGLVPDAVASTPEYRMAKARFQKAFARLREFNAVFTKRFAKELRAERASRYSNR